MSGDLKKKINFQNHFISKLFYLNLSEYQSISLLQYKFSWNNASKVHIIDLYINALIYNLLNIYEI